MPAGACGSSRSISSSFCFDSESSVASVLATCIAASWFSHFLQLQSKRYAVRSTLRRTSTCACGETYAIAAAAISRQPIGKKVGKEGARHALISSPAAMSLAATTKILDGLASRAPMLVSDGVRLTMALASQLQSEGIIEGYG